MTTTSEAMIPALENTTHFISNVTRELQGNYIILTKYWEYIVWIGNNRTWIELLTTVAPVFEETETAPPEIHDDLFQSKMVRFTH